MKNKKIKLSELIESPITGEWGKEIGKSENPNTVKVIRTTNFTNSGEINYSNITLRDIESQKCEKKRLKYGDIILEKSGGTDLNPVGRVVFFDKDDTNDIYLTNNFTTILRVKDKRINSKFLLLFLLYNYKYRGLHKFYNKTTGIQNLQVSNFINQVFVPLPEIEIQNKIIKVLENIKTVIKKQKEQLELLENLKKSQFFELFGDPIKNEKGWEKVSMDEISRLIIRGKTPKYVMDSKIGIINQSCIYWEKIKFENIKYHENNEKVLNLENQDVLINSTGTGTLGRVNIFTKDKENDKVYTIDTHVTLVRLKKEKVNSIYLKNFFRVPIVQEYLMSRCVNGSTNQIELSKEKFKKFRVLLPPLELQNKFATKIEVIQKLKFRKLKSLEKTENSKIIQKFLALK